MLGGGGGGTLAGGGGEFSYHPHLTLARTGRGGHAGREERGALRDAAEQLAAFQCAEWQVTDFQLMRSDFAGGPARYTTVGSWELAKE